MSDKLVGGMLRRRGRTWWVKFRDHKKRVKWLRAGTGRGPALALERRLVELAEWRGSGGAPPVELLTWLRTKLDAGRLGKLVEWGLVDRAVLVAGEPLERHVAAWEAYLEHGNTAKHAGQQAGRVRRLIDVAEAGQFHDLTGERVATALRKLGLSQSTRNHYRVAVRGFSRWMVDHGRASAEPAGLRLVRREQVTDRKVQRRALSDEEVGRLLSDAVPAARRLVYWVALQTGLRAGEMRKIEARWVHCAPGSAPGSGGGRSGDRRGYIEIPGAVSKSGKDERVPVAGELVEALAAAKAGLGATERMFAVPERAAEMVRADLAGIEGAEEVDFHSLRHTFITRLARGGVHPKVAQAMARHSTIELTMGYYTHLGLLDEEAAAAGLADGLGRLVGGAVERRAASGA